MSARDRPSTPSSVSTPGPGRLTGPGAAEVLTSAIHAAIESPAVLAVAALAGALGAVSPPFVDSLVQSVGTAVAVVLAARALGEPFDDWRFLVPRTLVAVLATLVAIVPILLGLLALVVPGVYVALRLLLATPAVMLDGHGPFEALSTSWDLMDGHVLAAFGALVVPLVAGLAVGFPLLLATRSELLAGAVLGLVVGAPAAGAQAFLYRELADR